MNGRSLVGGADDARHGPLWTDPFGNNAGEADHEGFVQLSLALIGGQQEQVCFLSAASVSGNPGACAKHGVPFLSRPGKWGQQALQSVGLWLNQRQRETQA